MVYLRMSVSMQPSPVASNPGFPSRILFHSFGENLQAVRDNIRDGKLGFEATFTVVKISQCLRQVVDGILSVVLTLLPPMNRLLQLLGRVADPRNLLFTASLSRHDNPGAQLGAVQFLQVYS